MNEILFYKILFGILIFYLMYEQVRFIYKKHYGRSSTRWHKKHARKTMKDYHEALKKLED